MNKSWKLMLGDTTVSNHSPFFINIFNNAIYSIKKTRRERERECVRYTEWVRAVESMIPHQIITMVLISRQQCIHFNFKQSAIGNQLLLFLIYYTYLLTLLNGVLFVFNRFGNRSW